jgi:hypothetical protein
VFVVIGLAFGFAFGFTAGFGARLGGGLVIVFGVVFVILNDFFRLDRGQLSFAVFLLQSLKLFRIPAGVRVQALCPFPVSHFHLFKAYAAIKVFHSSPPFPSAYRRGFCRAPARAAKQLSAYVGRDSIISAAKFTSMCIKIGTQMLLVLS